MSRPFTDLTRGLSQERRARIESKKAQLRSEMDLAELRQDLALTQAALARELGVGQAEISKLEKRADMLLSTLRKLVAAMGGQLEVRAVFPDRAVTIRDFSSLTSESPS